MESKLRRTSVFIVEGRRRFISYQIEGDYQKSWVAEKRFNRTSRNNHVVLGLIGLGVVLAAVYAFLIIRPAISGPFCLVFEDNFNQGRLDETKWNYAVQIDGFGTGSFDWTTTDPKNVYTDESGLHIVPTLTNETTSITSDQLFANYTLDLLKDKTCTGHSNTSCSVRSDPTQGHMIPPVRSGRVTTKGKASIRYGRVEVMAKIPKGDWLWPAIWMMPEDSIYGEWPRSGEIDIMEARGNSPQTYPGGRDIYFTTLHWGPSSSTDSYFDTQAVRALRRGDFSQDFHKYGLEWNEKYIYMYLDGRLDQVLYARFSADQNLWKKGGFDTKAENLTKLENPWAGSTSKTGNAPFDQKFHLIMNVAVGSRQGWFPDEIGGKPWIDAASNAQWMFWQDAHNWLPTWGEGDARGMTVRSVKMWQAGACGSPEGL